MYVRQIDIRRQSCAGDPMEKQGDKDAGRTLITQRDVPLFKLGTFVLKADFDDVDEFYAEKAKDELRETPEVVQQALKDIRAMLKDEPDLILPDDDQFYQKFLRPCKWYPKSAFGLMKRFYQFKIKNPRYCVDILPSNEKKVLSSEMVIPLPERTKDSCRLLLINAGKKWNPKLINTEEIFRSIMLSLDAAMAEPRTQVAGVHVILNMEGFALHHVTQFTPSFAAMVADWVQRCLPCRLKAVHVVNQPFVFNMVYAIFKPFLLEKLRKRIHFHGTNRNSLIAETGSKCLPIELGGEQEIPDEPIGPGIFEYFYWFEKDFEESNKYGYVGRKK